MKNDFEHVFILSDPHPAPTLLLLHGTGGNEHSLLELGKMIGPRTNLLSPRGKVLENGMPRFFERFPDGSFNLEDLQRRTDELCEFIQAAKNEYDLADSSLYAVGYSNGANIAVSVLLTHPSILAGALLLRPMLPYQPEHRPDLTSKNILILSGKNDHLVSPENVAGLTVLFEQSGALVDLEVLPGGHGLEERDVELSKQWLQSKLEVGI